MFAVYDNLDEVVTQQQDKGGAWASFLFLALAQHQLGKTDESHIIRTIEYWDIERKRYPQYDHTAVIVAEEITSRFLNVIGLFKPKCENISLFQKAKSRVWCIHPAPRRGVSRSSRT